MALRNSSRSFPTKKKTTLDYCDPGEILDLCATLVDSKSTGLFVKINNFVLQNQCQARFAFFILIQPTIGEAVVTVVDNVILPTQQKLLLNTNFFLQALKYKATCTVPVAHMDNELKALLNWAVTKDTVLKQMSAVPVPAGAGSEQYLVCIVDAPVTESVMAGIVKETMIFCSPVLVRTSAYEYEKRVKKQCQEVLQAARRLMMHVGEIRQLLQTMMAQARRLTGAHVCAVLLVDLEREQLVETVVQIGEEIENLASIPKSQATYRFPMHVGITGRAVDSGTLINVTNAKEHPLFEKTIDSRPGIATKSILCFPIREQDNIIGVAQLVNKVDDSFFSFADEEVCTAFGIYCGICITHALVHKQLRDACVRNKVANELMLYHMQVSDKDVRRIVECPGHQHRFDRMTNVHLNTRLVPKREHMCYIVEMFSSLGYMDKFDIKYEKLMRFLLYVQKGYRDVPYHNWCHAFAAAQFAYAAIVDLGLDKLLSELQCMMYLLACIVHDMDHRGTTNSYHMQGEGTTLGALYCSAGSVMERHHLSQALCVMRADGCDILSGLSRREYDAALFHLHDAVMATDLSNHFKRLEGYKEMAATGYRRGNDAHENKLLCLMMNAADFCDQIKDWGSVKHTAATALTEFFHQGDVLKSCGETPEAAMDRDRAFIPDLQIEFITHITIPLYTVAAAILPDLFPSIQVQRNHVKRWEASRATFEKAPPQEALKLLLSEELDAQIEAVLRKQEEAQEY